MSTTDGAGSGLWDRLIEALRSFRPTLVPTLIAIPGLVLLFGLGTWQVDRHFWKERINAERQAQANAPAVDLPAQVADPGALAFRRVKVSGTFDHAHEIFVNARSQRGNPGYDVITPLIRDGGASPVLVSRGWVPYERRDPTTRQQGLVDGTVTVEGILRIDARQGLFMPDNDSVRNSWFWFDLPAMSKAAGLSQPATYYIEADATPVPGIYPLGGQTRLELPSPHLQYAITWYCLAIAFAAIYVIYHLRREPPKA